LGDADPSTYSKTEDSLYFKNVDAVIEEIVNGSVINTYPLQETVLSDKTSGMFAYPNQKVYSFTAYPLNSSATYKLKGTANGISLSATTALLSETDPVFGNSGPSSFGRFWNIPGYIQLATSTNLNDGLTAKFRAPVGSREIRVDLIFYYDEEYEDGTIKTQNIRFNFGVQTFAEPNKLNEAEMVFSPNRFFEQIASNIPDKDATPGLKQRIPKYLDFEFGAIDEETFYYRDVNSPTSDVVQEKPNYTNIENGLGIFGSRLLVGMNEWTRKVGRYKGATTLERNSQIELAGSRIASEKGLGFSTSTKGFCVEKNLAAGSPSDLVCK
jgi:hypothetical protein